MTRHQHIFNYASKIIRNSDYDKAHSCVITSGGKIVTYGCCSAHKYDSDEGIYSIHAERSALNSLLSSLYSANKRARKYCLLHI